MKKVIFLDRDGVINKDHGYVSKIEDFEFIDGVFDTLKAFIDNGFSLIVITNQSGIARGYYSQNDFDKLSAWMIDQLKNKNIKIDALYHCPHLPDFGCDCRKPNIGMIKKACVEFDIDLDKSWMIGDKPSDIECALNAGISKSILIGKNKNDTKADFVVKSIQECKGIICDV